MSPFAGLLNDEPEALAAVYFAPKVSSAPSEILARTDDTMNTPAVNSFHLLSGVGGILQ